MFSGGEVRIVSLDSASTTLVMLSHDVSSLSSFLFLSSSDFSSSLTGVSVLVMIVGAGVVKRHVRSERSASCVATSGEIFSG